MNKNEWLEKTRTMGVHTWMSEQGASPKPMPLYEVHGAYVMGNHPDTWNNWTKTYRFRQGSAIEIKRTFIHPECVNINVHVDGGTGLMSVTGLFHISDIWLKESNDMLNAIIQVWAEDCGFRIAGAFGFRRYVMYMEEYNASNE